MYGFFSSFSCRLASTRETVFLAARSVGGVRLVRGCFLTGVEHKRRLCRPSFQVHLVHVVHMVHMVHRVHMFHRVNMVHWHNLVPLVSYQLCRTVVG
jgi:hypothetical protein